MIQQAVSAREIEQATANILEFGFDQRYVLCWAASVGRPGIIGAATVGLKIELRYGTWPGRGSVGEWFTTKARRHEGKGPAGKQMIAGRWPTFGVGLESG